MRKGRWTALPVLLVAAVALVVGLAVPAAAREAGALINGKSIAVGSIPGNRLKVNAVTGRQIKESTLGIVPRAAHAKTAAALPALKWHTITGYENDWQAYGAAEGPTRYAIDAQGIVHFGGAIKSGANALVAFLLPSSVVSSSREIDIPIICAGPSVGEFLVVNGEATVHNIGASDCQTIAVLTGVTFTAG
jgi:hypothetical protein